MATQPSVSTISPPTPFVLLVPPTSDGQSVFLSLGSAAFMNVGTGANEVSVGNHTHPDLAFSIDVYTKVEVDDIIDDLEPVYINVDEDIDGGLF